MLQLWFRVLVCFFIVALIFPKLAIAQNCNHLFKHPTTRAIHQYKPEDLSLDTLFAFDRLKEPEVNLLVRPFAWHIKDAKGNIRGAFIGSYHRYASAIWLPMNVQRIIRSASTILLESDGRIPFDLYQRWIQETDPYNNSDHFLNHLSPQQIGKIEQDFAEFVARRNHMAMVHNQDWVPQSLNLDLNGLTTFGFLQRLSMLAEIRSSSDSYKLALDDEIAMVATHFGAKLGYLESYSEFIGEFAQAAKLTDLYHLVNLPHNIFDHLYNNLRTEASAYQKGDLDYFSRQTEFEGAESHRLTLVLRNQRWVPRIIDKLETENFTLVVAGVSHFAGQQNLLQLMERHGYQLERIAGTTK